MRAEDGELHQFPNTPAAYSTRFHPFTLRSPRARAPLNGLAFERAADPDALPDEVFAEFVTAVLGCAIAAP